MALAMLPHLEIVDRVKNQFPAVESVIVFANTRYTAIKNYNELSKSTFGKAENTFQYLIETVSPTIGRFEQPIHYADSMAVRGLESLNSSIDSITKSSSELKSNTVAAIDQTRARLNSMKNETLEKVQSVLTVPANVFPLINNIFAAGDYILDYILPPPEGFKTTPPADYHVELAEHEQTSDFTVIFRALIVRMKHFTERVHERLVIYSREKWFPGLWNSVGHFKGNVESLVNSSPVTEAKKLLNGHSGQGQVSNSSAQPAKVNGQPTEKVKQSKKGKKEKKAEEMKNMGESQAMPNGDASPTPMVSDEQQQK